MKKNPAHFNPEWRTRGFWDPAICSGRPSEYVTAHLPQNFHERLAEARRRCAGCPMMQDCAQWALSEEELLQGMVAAGQPLPDRTGKEMTIIRGRLQDIAQGNDPRPVPRSRPRKRVRTEPKVRPTGDHGHSNCLRCDVSTRPHKAHASEWPNTVPEEGRGLCGPCYSRSRRDGTLSDYKLRNTGGRPKRPVDVSA